MSDTITPTALDDLELRMQSEYLTDPNACGLPSFVPWLKAGAPEAFVRELWDGGHERYVSHALGGMLSQTASGSERKGLWTTYETPILINPYYLGEICAYLRGFKKSGEPPIDLREFLPVFDVHVAPGLSVAVKLEATSKRDRAFTLRAAGVAGGFGIESAISVSQDFEGRSSSFQGQAACRFFLTKYRNADNEYLYIADVANIAAGIALVGADAPRYVEIDAPRQDKLVTYIGDDENAGAATAKISFGYKSTFKIKKEIEAGPSLDFELSSKCNTELSLLCKFPGGAAYDAFGPTEAPVLWWFDPAS